MLNIYIKTHPLFLKLLNFKFYLEKDNPLFWYISVYDELLIYNISYKNKT